MIKIDGGERKYCMIIADCEGEQQEGHRTTLSLSHEDGLELRAQLNAYYTDQPVEQETLKNMAIDMLLDLAGSAADKQQAALLQELIGKATGKETPNATRQPPKSDGGT